jgi:hypothetical protein
LQKPSRCCGPRERLRSLFGGEPEGGDSPVAGPRAKVPKAFQVPFGESGVCEAPAEHMSMGEGTGRIGLRVMRVSTGSNDVGVTQPPVITNR